MLPKIAQIDDFIDGLEDGYHARVAQGGGNFSGGQKQRLAIARALVKRPEIYIFDDSFSALDFKTDAKLRAALKRKRKTPSSSWWHSASVPFWTRIKLSCLTRAGWSESARIRSCCNPAPFTGRLPNPSSVRRN